MFKKITKKITIIASSIPLSARGLTNNNKDYQEYFHDVTTVENNDAGDDDSDSDDDNIDDEMDVVPMRNSDGNMKTKPSNQPKKEKESSYDNSSSTIFQMNKSGNSHLHHTPSKNGSNTFRSTSSSSNDILSPSKRKRENNTFDKENLPQNVMNANTNKDRIDAMKKVKDRRFDTMRQQAEKIELKHPLHNINDKTPKFEDIDDADIAVDDDGDEDFIISVFSKIRHNHIDTISEYLKTKKVSCSMKDKQHGNTILHVCAQNNHTKMMTMIIKSNTKNNDRSKIINPLNKKGMTPLDYAYHYKFYGLATQLEAVGALPGSRVLVGDNSYRK